jgi:mitochondrial fission protein ELM1
MNRPVPSVWVLTDGKIGDEGQCVAVAEALGAAPEIRRIAPRSLYAMAMPWGGIDPRDAPNKPGSPIAGPYPDLCIASGRRAVAYLRAVKAASGGKTFTVFLKDPRTGTKDADLIWVPDHDRLRGPNVLATLVSPHRFTPERLAALRAAPPAALAGLAAPRVAVLVGGKSRDYDFTPADAERFLADLDGLAVHARLMVTASRRTPDRLREAVLGLARAKGGFGWDGTGENPYPAMLALADAFVVTADSANMVSEAVATGRPVMVFEPSLRFGRSAKRIRHFIAALEAKGAVRKFQGRLESYAYEPLVSTPEIAAAIAAAMAAYP